MLKAAFLVGLGGFGLLAACSPFGGASVFNCENDSQCTPNGRCVQAEGLCVFPDPGCTETMEKYGPHSGSKSGTCYGSTTPVVDAPPDEAPPQTCTPNAVQCFGAAIETCRADGMGLDPAKRVPCALTCITSGTPTCVAATGIGAPEQTMCNADGTAPALTPTSGTVTISATTITCSAGCGGGNNTINRTGTTPNNFYCLSSITIPSGVTVDYGNNNITAGVTLFSSGAVMIGGTINFSGKNAQLAITGGGAAGGPGGSSGGDVVANDQPGQNGNGPGTCGGRGGDPAGGGQTGANGAGGGGGGGGNAGTGGVGGNGLSQNGTTANGGAAGTNTNCSTPEGKPLVGGAGGGGGADGNGGAGVPCGWPGGGGGGAIQIVSRSAVTVTGTISANGGNGFGNGTAGGGGGGGAGGMILLEAPMVSYGTLTVNGGNGGNTDVNGGAGASAGLPNGTGGTNANANLQGGAGGGGGSGRIRINATNAACGAGISPTASCTSAPLRTMP